MSFGLVFFEVLYILYSFHVVFVVTDETQKADICVVQI